jgi:hypothetical protein
MSEQCGLTVVKRFTYRGDASEEFSNTYWLTGDIPADATEWRALFDAMVTQEKTCYNNGVNVIRGYGYADNTGHRSGDTGTVAASVWTVDLTVSPETPVAGTITLGAGESVAPGDAAAWARWKTSRLTDPGGKPIYLRKYFHGINMQAAPNQDQIKATQKTNLAAFAEKLRDGTFIDARTVTAAGSTDTITATGASTYVTTRTLKRRGKRPGS